MFVTLSLFTKWTGFRPLPATTSQGRPRWRVVATVSILPINEDNLVDTDNEEDDEESFISIGVCIAGRDYGIHGVESQSLGYHSDDGMIYMESLVVAKAEPYDVGDEIRVGVDYRRGNIYFQKNRITMAVVPLHGEMLSFPLHVGVTYSDNKPPNAKAVIW